MTAPIDQKSIDTAQRLTRDQWEALRTKMGRVTPDVSSLTDLDQQSIFLSYQQELISSTAMHKVVVVEKSRRTGATWALAADAVLTSATDKSEGGMDTLYIGYNLDMAKEFIDTAADWARDFHTILVEAEQFIFLDTDKDGNTKEILAFRIKFASGNEIVALTSNPRSLRGRQGYVIIDEAAFHDDFKGLLKAALALLIWGGKVCIISTHDGADNPYNELIEEIRSGRRNYQLVRFDFDDALKAGLYERVCMRTNKEWSPENEAEWRESIVDDYGDGAAEELYCVPSQGSGTYLEGALIRANMHPDVPILRWEPHKDFVHEPEAERVKTTKDWLKENVAPLLEGWDKDLRNTFGLDFGRVADLTVLWINVIERTLHQRVPFLIELRNVPFEQQKQIVLYVLKRISRRVTGAVDGGGNGAYLAEVVQQSLGERNVEIIHFSQAFYRDNFPKLKAELEDRNQDVPKDDDVFTDFRAVRTVSGTPQVPSDKRSLEKASKGRKRHGDSVIAALLANYAANLNHVEYDYTPLSALNERTEEDRDWNGSTMFNDRSEGLY